MKGSLSIAAARRVKIAVGALALLSALVGSFPASAQQPAENMIGVYAFNSNFHVGIDLHITRQVPISPHPNTGQPRGRIEGFVANGSIREPVVGFVTGFWSAQQAQPVSISFSRKLQNGIVQTYQGAVGRNTSGRMLMTGIFNHPGAGSPFPWLAER
jgi:hypothetical protein